MPRRMSVGILALSSLLGCTHTPASHGPSSVAAAIAPATAASPPVASAPVASPTSALPTAAPPAAASPTAASPPVAPSIAAPSPAPVAAAPVQTKKPVPDASSKTTRDKETTRDKDSSVRTAAAPPPTQTAVAHTDKAPLAKSQVAATPELDLPALEQRLKDTHAIGVFSKLSLKNQVDDLLSQFRAFYGGQARTSLTDLRQRYDLLLLKVLSLLQDGDPPLASAISTSREAIWGVLADREKFQKILSS
jgi:hypothetical protein